MLPCVSILGGGKKGIPSPGQILAATTVEYLRVDEGKEGKHSFVGEPERVPQSRSEGSARAGEDDAMPYSFSSLFLLQLKNCFLLC